VMNWSRFLRRAELGGILRSSRTSEDHSAT